MDVCTSISTFSIRSKTTMNFNNLNFFVSEESCVIMLVYGSFHPYVALDNQDEHSMNTYSFSKHFNTQRCLMQSINRLPFGWNNFFVRIIPLNRNRKIKLI